MTLLELSNACRRLLDEECVDPETEVYITYKEINFGEYYTSKAAVVKQIVTDGGAYTFDSLEQARNNISTETIEKINLKKAIGICEDYEN